MWGKEMGCLAGINVFITEAKEKLSASCKTWVFGQLESSLGNFVSGPLGPGKL